MRPYGQRPHRVCSCCTDRDAICFRDKRRERRRWRGTRHLLTVLLAALLLLARPALADCDCETDANGDCMGVVTCDPATYNRLAHAEQDATHRAEVAEAARDRASADLSASLQRLWTAEHPAPVWPYLTTGVAAGVATVLAVWLVVR